MTSIPTGTNAALTGAQNGLGAIIQPVVPKPLEAMIESVEGMGLSATIQGVGEGLGEGTLKYSAGGATCAVDIFEGGEKESKRIKKAREEVEKDLQELWELAKKVVPEHTETLDINFGLIYITYSYRDKDGKEVKKTLRGDKEIEAKDPRVAELMKKVRDGSKSLWRHVNHGSEWGSEANRSLYGGKAFERYTKHWEENHSRSLDEFLERDFDALRGYVSSIGGSGEEAFRRVVAAESFIHALLGCVGYLRREREKQINAPGFARSPNNEKLKLQKSLADLKSLEERLGQQGIDRNPVNWNVGICGARSLSKMTEEQRGEFGELVEAGLETHLRSKLTPGVDDRGVIRKVIASAAGLLGIPDIEGEGRMALGPFVRNYALDAKDLSKHNKYELARNLDAEGREMKTVSLEEFVTHNITELDDPSFDAGKALKSLGLKVDDETQGLLAAAIGQARKDALAADAAAKRIYSSESGKVLSQQMRNNSALTHLVGAR